MNHSKKIDVDTRTFVRFWLVIAAFVLLGLFLWKARVGLIIVGIAIFLSIAIQPLAARIKKLTGKSSSSFASAMAYTIIILALGIILAVVAPVVIDETSKFVRTLPETFETNFGGWDSINALGRNFGIENLQSEIGVALQSFSNNFAKDFSGFLVNGIGTISSALTAIILTLILTLLLSLEGPGIVESFWRNVEGKRKSSAIRAYKRLLNRLAEVISTYVSKQITVAVLDGCVVGVVVFLLSLILNFSSTLALPLGLLAFIFYLIPMFGPIISCILNALLLFFSCPVAAAVYLIFYIVYAQIENNFIAPKLQGDAQGLPTSVILIAITIGMYMFGLIGAIVAIPIAGCAKVILEELPNLRDADAL